MVDTASTSKQAPTTEISSISLNIHPPTVFQLPIASPQVNAEAAIIPPHRSHDRNNNLKRTDPFVFGSRYLEENDNVYEFNAWDHVIPDASHYEYAQNQYNFQRANPVSDFDKKRFNDQPEKWWNKFYSNNTSNFFKDRKWLHQEFPILSQLTKAESPPAVVLEVGAGAGNTAFPILKANENPRLMLHACDFSSKAVELMKANEAYDPARISASVWDIASDDLPEGLLEGGVDVVLLVFIFSALSPRQWDAAVRNIWRTLKPGGEVCFRDYGKGDLTQVRFKKGRWMEENFYIRGDGTRVYFFSEDELKKIWGGQENAMQVKDEEAIMQGNHQPKPESKQTIEQLDNRMVDGAFDPQNQFSVTRALRNPANAFEILSLGVDRRMLVNRQKQLKMYRCWMQGRFKKPVSIKMQP